MTIFHLFTSFFLSLFLSQLCVRTSPFPLFFERGVIASPLLPPSSSKKRKTRRRCIKGTTVTNCGVFLDIITLVRHEPTSGTRFEGLSTRLSLNYSRNYSFSNKSFILSERKKLCFPLSLSLRSNRCGAESSGIRGCNYAL